MNTSSFVLYKKKIWLPVFIGKRQSTYILPPSSKTRVYTSVAASDHCLNPLCNQNCPLCPPFHEAPPAESQPLPNYLPAHVPCKSYHDTILLKNDGDDLQAVGLLNTEKYEIVLFPHSRYFAPVQQGAEWPNTMTCPIPVDAIKTSTNVLVGSKYLVRDYRANRDLVDHDWKALKKRIVQILLNNMLKIDMDANQVVYSFGSLPIDVVCAFAGISGPELQIPEPQHLVLTNRNLV